MFPTFFFKKKKRKVFLLFQYILCTFRIFMLMRLLHLQSRCDQFLQSPQLCFLDSTFQLQLTRMMTDKKGCGCFGSTPTPVCQIKHINFAHVRKLEDRKIA